MDARPPPVAWLAGFEKCALFSDSMEYWFSPEYPSLSTAGMATDPDVGWLTLDVLRSIMVALDMDKEEKGIC